MSTEVTIKTYDRFDDYYIDARSPLRCRCDDFHVFRLSEVGDEIVPAMGPFRITYLHFAIGAELNATVDVFDSRNLSESWSAVIYLPGQIVRWEKTGRWDGYLVNVREEFLNLPAIGPLGDSYAFLHSLEPLVFQIRRDDYQVLSHLCELMLVEHAEMGEENRMVIRNLMQVFIVYLNRLISTRSDESNFAEMHYQETATRFKSMALMHYQAERSVSYYADVLGVTPAYLTGAVKRVYRRTPKQILNEIVLLHARTALAFSSASLKEIAYTLRFDDYSHFAKFFRKMTGVAPSDYRSVNRGEP